MKLQRLDNNHQPETGAAVDENVTTLANGVTITDLPDFSKKIVIPEKLLPGGLTVVFRDPSQADLEFFELQTKESRTQLEAIKRFGARICIQWGDRDGITLPQWDKLRGAVSVILIKVLNNFFPDSTAE